MKIAAAFLADAANVRENTLSVLSGFINQLYRTEFPAVFGATLVIVTDVLVEAGGPSIKVSFSFSLRSSQTGQVLWGEDGELEIEAEAGRRGYIPILIPLTDLEIPEPGSYEITVRLGDDQRRIEFYADLAD